MPLYRYTRKFFEKYGADWNRQESYDRLVSMQEYDSYLLHQSAIEQ